MTKLVVEELRTTLSQSFTLELSRRYHIYAIKPHVYLHNSPAGTFTFTIKSGSTSLASSSFTSQDCKDDLSTANDYIRINKALILSQPLSIDGGTYTLELSSSGYTYTSSSFIGWVKEHENIFSDITGTTETDLDNAQTFLLFEKVKI